MLVLQINQFKKAVKKLTSKNTKHKLILDDVIKEIITNPTIGEMKKGDLSGVYVYKFKLYLLAYSVYTNSILTYSLTISIVI